MLVENLPYLLIMMLCLILSGFFSAAEVAFEEVNRNRIRLLAEKGGRRAGMALRLSENEDRMATTILIGDTAADVTLAALATLVLIRTLQSGMGALWAILLCGGAILLLGETIPKHIAAARPESTALLCAPILQGFVWLFSPVTALLGLIKRLLDRVCKHEDEDRISQEELLLLVDEAQQDGGIVIESVNFVEHVIEALYFFAEQMLHENLLVRNQTMGL